LRLFSGYFKRRASEKKLKEAIKNLFGYVPKNISLYKLALRHRSLAGLEQSNGVDCNERLEYLGDAILGAIVADFLYRKFPFKGEGFLTEMRSRMVCRSYLNALARKMGLDKLIQTNNGHKLATSAILGDAFEALVGAMFFDKGYNFAYEVVVNRIIPCHIDVDELLKSESNYKSRILEWVQKEKLSHEFVLVKDNDGDNCNRIFSVDLFIGGELVGKGSDYSIKKAEQKAARLAWGKIIASQD
jgi:ribonuclease-3